MNKQLTKKRKRKCKWTKSIGKTSNLQVTGNPIFTHKTGK